MRMSDWSSDVGSSVHIGWIYRAWLRHAVRTGVIKFVIDPSDVRQTSEDLDEPLQLRSHEHVVGVAGENILAPACFEGGVQGTGLTSTILKNRPDAPVVALDHLAGAIGGTVVDDDHFHLRVRLRQRGLDRGREVAAIIVIVYQNTRKRPILIFSYFHLPNHRENR